MSSKDIVYFRDIVPKDESSLLVLRNNPSSLIWFQNSQEVSEPDHTRWFIARLSKFKGMQFVGECDGTVIGVAYLTPTSEKSATVSINIDPHFQSEGIGHQLLNRIMARAITLGFSQVEAIIHSSNSKSIALFEKCGFVLAETISSRFSIYRKFQ